QVLLYAGLFVFAEYLVDWLHLPLPANLVGMVLMLTLILCRALPLNWVRAGARWLLAEMLLFFVPAVVAVVNYAQLLMVDGWRIFARPIRPEDEPTIHEFLKHVTAEDLRLRFFAPMKEFTHEFIARLTQLDYSRAMAFVALDETTNELVGVVRIHSDSVYESGEYAILLRSDLKGRGLGWALMQLIIEYAKAEDLKMISGDVLQENIVMLEMCRNLGFEVKTDPTERDLCNVKLRL
ncbi:MAG: GNAT family N-acetyltransferase, partial [Bradyrhizobium sp.]|nr:GNAT family N-acetyltransferase [Bradyrhizobium sp.]